MVLSSGANITLLSQIAEQLSKAGIPFVRFDGSMSSARRKEALERFNIPLTGNSCQPSAMASSGTIAHERRMSSQRVDKPDEVNGKLDSTDTGSMGRRASGKLAADEDSVLSSRELTPERTMTSLMGGGDTESKDVSWGTKEPNVSKAGKGKGKTHIPELSDDSHPADDVEVIITGTRKVAKGKAVAISGPGHRKVDHDAILRSYDLDNGVPVVLLITLKAGALGLQLTAANNVFLVRACLIPSSP